MREVLTIIFVLKKLSCYFLYLKFKLFTDLEALKYVMDMKEPDERMNRWMTTFAENLFGIAHNPGSKSQNKYYLSRPTDVEGIVLNVSNWIRFGCIQAVHYHLYY